MAGDWIDSTPQFEVGTLQGNAILQNGGITLSAQGFGSFVSQPIDMHRAVDWHRIAWDGENLHGLISVRTRYAIVPEEIEASRWSAPYTCSGSAIRIQGSIPMTQLQAAARVIQYRIDLHSLDGKIPFVKEVRLSYRLVRPAGYWPADCAEAHPEELVLKWLPSSGASCYEIEVAADDTFSRGVQTFQSRETSYRLPGDIVEIGRELWWRVRALDNSGMPSEYSACRCVRISERRQNDRYTCHDHPRLFITKDNLDALRKTILEDPKAKDVYSKIQAHADECLDVVVPPYEAVAEVPGQHGGFFKAAHIAQDALVHLAFCYLVTGQEKYAISARRVMIELAAYSRWTGVQFSNPQHFNPPWSGTLETAGICRGIATAYDWIYDYLSEADRAYIRERWIKLGIEPLIKDWGNPETYHLVPRHQLAAGNWWAVCNSGAGLSALALLGEVPEADSWVRLVEDAIRWYLVYRGGDVWNIDLRAGDGREHITLTEPNYGCDGGYVESIGYIHYGLLNAMLFVDALKRSTGVDLGPWVRSDILNEPLYGLFYDTERGWVTVNFNDSGDGSNLSADIYALVALHTGNPYVKWMLEETRGGIDSIHSLLAQSTVPAPRNPEDLPKAKHFRDIGWVFFRTGWDHSASLLAAKFHQGRGHEDLGQFVIYHQGRQHIVDAGTINYADPIYATFLNQTKAHNTIMVDHQRQWRLDGTITDFLYQDGLGFAVADLSDAYQDLINHWHRGVAFLDSGIYVVWDKLNSEDSHVYSWLLHPGMDFQVSDGSVSVGDGESSLNLALLSTQHVEAAVLPGYILDREKPYVAFSAVGAGNIEFLGLFSDSSFTSRKQIDQTTIEISSETRKCLASLGRFCSDSISFSGELLVLESVTSEDKPFRFMAYRCCQVEIPGLKLLSAGEDLTLIGVRAGNTWKIRANYSRVADLIAESDTHIEIVCE